MDESQILRLLIGCGFGAAVGGYASGWAGGHMIAAVAAIAAFAAWTEHVSFSWLEVVAPVAFAYGAAALAQSARRAKDDKR